MKRNLKQETTLFCEQLAMILQSGIALSDGIRAMGEEVEDAPYQHLLLQMADQLDEQVSFKEVLEKAGIYDEYMIHMVEVGEKSGYLDQVMTQLAIYYGRMDETREKIKDAVTYPGVLICMMLAVIGVLVIKVLPLFRQVLNGMGAELGSFALMLMQTGNLLAKVGLVILLIIALVVLISWFRIKKEKRSLMSVLSSFPLSKRMGQDLSVAQFAYAMSLLLSSGYDTDEALAMMPAMLDDAGLKKKIAALRERIATGDSFHQALVESGIFKGIYNRILVIGFKAGKAEETMARVAQQYEDEVDASINRFLDIIEPTLVAVLSVIVGIILLSVMLPLMSIMSSLG